MRALQRVAGVVRLRVPEAGAQQPLQDGDWVEADCALAQAVLHARLVCQPPDTVCRQNWHPVDVFGWDLMWCRSSGLHTATCDVIHVVQGAGSGACKCLSCFKRLF